MAKRKIRKYKKEKRKKNKWKKWFKKNKYIVISISIVLGVFLIAFGAKTTLYINFLLGNDIVIKLNVDKADLSLVHGQEENITFEASVTTNPFCKADCESDSRCHWVCGTGIPRRSSESHKDQIRQPRG